VPLLEEVRKTNPFAHFSFMFTRFCVVVSLASRQPVVFRANHTWYFVSAFLRFFGNDRLVCSIGSRCRRWMRLSICRACAMNKHRQVNNALFVLSIIPHGSQS
jgi:hypothetical protein